MAESKFRNEWSELNDPSVIEELQQNRHSEHWNTCTDYLCYYIDRNFSNLLPHLRADTIQDILLLTFNGLPTFRSESKFITWFAKIAYFHIIDVLRKQKKITFWEQHPDDLPEEHEGDIGYPLTSPTRTPEEIVLAKERREEVSAALDVFLRLHSKPKRNKKILELVMFEGYSYEETAKILGINAPVVGHVVRSAREYLLERYPEFKRIKLKDK